MRILSFNTIDSFARNHLEAATMVEWVEDALTHKQEAILPAKTEVDLDERLLGCPGTGFYDVMPAIVPHLGIAGTKLVDGFPQRSPSVAAEITVTDLATGELLALVDGTWITAWRTGAVAAHSALTFANTHPTTNAHAVTNARPTDGSSSNGSPTDGSSADSNYADMQRIGIVGLGITAVTFLHIMASAHPERFYEVTVLQYKDQHERFAERFTGFPNVVLPICAS